MLHRIFKRKKKIFRILRRKKGKKEKKTNKSKKYEVESESYQSNLEDFQEKEREQEREAVNFYNDCAFERKKQHKIGEKGLNLTF